MDRIGRETMWMAKNRLDLGQAYAMLAAFGAVAIIPIETRD
jgi:multidrug transporter EmrE-like cation transporter